MENSNEDTKTFSVSRGLFLPFKTTYPLHNIRVQEEAASADHVSALKFGAPIFGGLNDFAKKNIRYFLNFVDLLYCHYILEMIVDVEGIGFNY